MLIVNVFRCLEDCEPSRKSLIVFKLYFPFLFGEKLPHIPPHA